MAEEPKKVRKRAVKKSASKTADSPEKESPAKEKKSKSAGVIPAPIFQAAPVAAAPKKNNSQKPVKNDSSNREVEDLSTDNENRRRRRRRGGRGRRRSDKDESGATENTQSPVVNEESPTSAGFKKRRRRRRSGADGVTPGETVEEDGVVTVVKVREARPAQERPIRERKNFDRGNRHDRKFRDRDRDRDRGRERNRYNDYRENRRRGTILTDAEFLARRESVDREMLVRQQGDRTQIAILEDNVLVEHYVNRNSNISYVGNVYLGKVQNVLPSMEAAFVDIGKGRNAVLYAGEVNWDEAGLTDNQERKIERVLKTGQSVLVQVTKDPIGQKGEIGRAHV